LRDVIVAVRADEAEHRDVNHAMVSHLDSSKDNAESKRRELGST
jgi:ubiquinol oxidase